MSQLFEFPRHFEGKQDIDLYIVKRIRGLKKMVILHDLFHPDLNFFFTYFICILLYLHQERF